MFFSHSATECKLSDTCDGINSFEMDFTIYHLALTVAPIFVPEVPRHAPTPLVYTLWNAVEICKGTPLAFPTAADLQACGVACLAQLGCAFFSFSSSSRGCQLTSSCDRIRWMTDCVIYELGAR
ncbi:unnamed protein product [Prorocentrum cordatum]|uniref:Apple domain-containing protein n=1 Tax=Prorocentrum cordatum TaxID=2364126 RepID=A0ABN9UN86_9DINO|nr:unnamed protein product [Polarella glacialis]